MKTFTKNTVALVALVAVLLCAFPAFAADESAPSRVNINTATAEQLALLPRVGPALAGRIVDFREENGEFTSPHDLILVSGIGEKTFALLEAYVKVEGETTLTSKIRTSDAQARLAKEMAEPEGE